MATFGSRVGGLQVPFDATGDPRKYAYIFADFLGGLGGTRDDTHVGLGEAGLKVTDIAGAADSDVDIVSTAATIEGHPGVISLNTGPTTPAAGDEAGLTLPGAVAVDGTAGPSVYAAAQVRFPSIASIEFNFGLFAVGLGAGRDTDSVSIEFDASADAEFNAVSVAASSATAVASTVTVAADTWYTLEVVLSSGTAFFYVNGDYVTEIETNVPTDTALVAGFKVATETTAEKSVLIDWIAVRSPVDRD